MEDNFPPTWEEVGEGWFPDDSIVLHIVHFISVIITSAPPQIIRH